MTKIEDKTAAGSVQEILLSNPDGFREVIRAVMPVIRNHSARAAGFASGF